MAEATANESQAAAATEVQEAELPEAAEGNASGGGGQIDILLDTALEVSVCLGQAELKVREVLQLGPGSVVQLDKQAGEPVDLYLRGRQFATGTLVVVGDQLGVRIKEIAPSDSRATPATASAEDEGE